jgi:hypothetical protein
MFPPLSDSTKKFIAVCAVLAVALCNVVFGMDWLAERLPVRPLAAVTGVTEPPMLASPPVQAARPPVQAARPAPPAAAGSPPLQGNTAAAPPDRGATRPNAAAQTNALAAPQIGAPQPLCDVTACAAAYHSFTASDCTYMPSAGVRRLCTKGTPPQ